MSNEVQGYRFALMGQYRVHPLRGEVVVIGRHHTIPCFRYPEDLNETFPSLSSLHAVLYPWGHTYAIYDLASKFGVLVNGRKIKGECRLHLDDVIELGDLKVTFGLDERKPLVDPRPLHPDEEHHYPGPVSPKDLGRIILEANETFRNQNDPEEIMSTAIEYGQRLTFADRAYVIIEDDGFYKRKSHFKLASTDGKQTIPPTEASLVPTSVWSHLSSRSIALFGRTAFGLVNPGPFNIGSVISVLAMPFVADDRLFGGLIVENYRGSHRFTAGMAFATLILAERAAKALYETGFWTPKGRTPRWNPPLREEPYETFEICGPTGKQLLDHRSQLFCGTPCKLQGDHLFENQPNRALLIPERSCREPMRIFPLVGHKVMVNGELVDFAQVVKEGDLVTIDDTKILFDKVLAYSDEISANRKRSPGNVDLQRYLQIEWHKKAQLPEGLLPREKYVFWPDRLEQ